MAVQEPQARSTDRSAGATSGAASPTRSNRSATVAPSSSSRLSSGAWARVARPAPRRTRTCMASEDATLRRRLEAVVTERAKG